MNIHFKKHLPHMADNFFDYFENNAFPANDTRANCYCLESHLSNEGEITTTKARRQKAGELIERGVMTGYLVYDESKVIGWCNAGDKMSYLPICENRDFRTDDCEKAGL